MSGQVGVPLRANHLLTLSNSVSIDALRESSPLYSSANSDHFMSLKLEAPPYKGTGGHYLTSQLFYERWIDLKDYEQTFEPLFSLNGKEGYIDARTTFVLLEDPTGYKWAVQYLGSWKHWERLMATSWFPPQVEEWTKEIRTKLKADALKRIREIAGSGAPTALAASKYLANMEYDSVRGRPSNSELKGELKRQVAVIRQEDADAERIGLKGKTN